MKNKKTIVTLITSSLLSGAGISSAAITAVSDDFSTNTVGSWFSVGAVTPKGIDWKPVSVNDLDKLDLINSQANALDGDGIIGNLAGDTEATGDGAAGDGALIFDTINATIGDEEIALNIGGSMELGEVITLQMGMFNDNNSYARFSISLYNSTDNTELATTIPLFISGQGGGTYAPIDSTFSFTASATDVGDSLQIRILDDAQSTGRDAHVDNFSLTTSIPEPSTALLGALGALALLRRRR